MRRTPNLLLVGFVCLVWLGTPVVHARYPPARGGLQTFCADSGVQGWQLRTPLSVTYKWVDDTFTTHTGGPNAQSMRFMVPTRFAPGAALSWSAVALLWWVGFALQVAQLWLRRSGDRLTAAQRALARSPLLAATGLTALWWPLVMTLLGPQFGCFSLMMFLWGDASLALEEARASLPAAVSPTVWPHAAFVPLALATVVTLVLLWRAARRPATPARPEAMPKRRERA